MIRLHMTRAESPMWVSLQLPATPADVGLAFARLDQISTKDKTVLKDVDCSVPSLHQYLMGADPDNGDDLIRLNRLAEKIESLTPRQCDILAGAVKAESINGMDDVLHIADRVDAYVIVPNVTSDAELGRFVAVSSQLHGDPRFPEESWPYLDYAKIGAECYANLGGAYTAKGYVLHKDAADRETHANGYLTPEENEITMDHSMQMGGM